MGSLLPWLQFPGSSLGLLELAINGSHPEWRPTSSEHGEVAIGMSRLMKMLRFYDLKMKSPEKYDGFGQQGGYRRYLFANVGFVSFVLAVFFGYLCFVAFFAIHTH